jgi:hypothetical protein
MDEFELAKRAGAEVFKRAIAHINENGWNHNSMEILLQVSDHKVWPQPMAVIMFSELGHALGSKTLTQFDMTATLKEATALFQSVIDQLTTSN